jgi:ParB family chromosome partitioning protein
MAIGKSKIGAAPMFAGAKEKQQVFHLKTQVEELEAEIAQLKAASGTFNSEEKDELEAKIQSLIEELAQSEGVREVPLEEITRNPLQPRVVFTKTEQQGFANLLKEEGQLSPILLIELTEENRSQLEAYLQQGLFDRNQPLFNLHARYILFDGERRWRSATLAGWVALKAVIMPHQESLDLLKLQSKALSTTLHAKDLHDLELAQTLITQISYHYPELNSTLDDPADIAFPRVLNNALARMKRGGKATELTTMTSASREEQLQWLADIELNELEQAVLNVILSYQQHPGSISRHVFPLLKLPEDLKQAVWDEGLEPSKLKLLAKLDSVTLQVAPKQAETIRINLTRQAISAGWSTEVLRTKVQETISEYNTDVQSTQQPPLLKKLKSLDIAQIPVDELQQYHDVFEQTLRGIKQRLKALA